nr:ATP-binding protein [Streptomyces sp. 2131.1]
MTTPASLRAFDFDANPNIDAATTHTASCEWIKKGQPLCLIGDSGTGKSHMLISLRAGAAMKGYRVRYTLATKLVNELVEAADEKQLNKTIARYGRVDLLYIDELGYMELDRRGADHLGYDKHNPAGKNGGNSRNGTRLRADGCRPGEISVSWDRDGSFEPKIVKKRQKRLTGVDEMVISLSAKGLTTGEVQAHLEGVAEGRAWAGWSGC